VKRRKFYVNPEKSPHCPWGIYEGRAILTVGRTKRQAVVKAQQMARAAKPSQLIIRRRDGTIQDERTYGADPYPPKG